MARPGAGSQKGKPPPSVSVWGPRLAMRTKASRRPDGHSTARSASRDLPRPKVGQGLLVDAKLEPVASRYLGDPEAVKARAEAVARQAEKKPA